MKMQWKIYIENENEMENIHRFFFLICKPSMLGEEFNKKFKLVEYSTIFFKMDRERRKKLRKERRCERLPS